METAYSLYEIQKININVTSVFTVSFFGFVFMTAYSCQWIVNSDFYCDRWRRRAAPRVLAAKTLKHGGRGEATCSLSCCILKESMYRKWAPYLRYLSTLFC